MAARNKVLDHWPILALLVIVFAILLSAMVLYQVKETEYVVVERWRKPQPERDTSPGLHPRWPYPIEDLWRHDNRIFMFTGNQGELEEVVTSDARNVIVTVFVSWRIYADAENPNTSIIKYRERIGDKQAAEEKLTGLLRNAKRQVFGRYSLAQLVNQDPQQVKIDEIEAALLAEIVKTAKSDFAIDVIRVGIAYIGLPKSATAEVFQRMRAERKIESDGIEAEGEAKAKEIRANADKDKEVTLAQARARAESIRAEGDRIANESYKEFQRNPQLAIFLQQLTALEKILSKKTYLVLDTTTPPINLMTKDAFNNLQKQQAEKGDTTNE